MIDLIEMKSSQASLSGDTAHVTLGTVASIWDSGPSKVVVATFPLVQPCEYTLWKGALLQVDDPTDTRIRIRLSNGTDDYWMNETTLVIAKVTATNWESQYSPAWVLDNLDLWTHPGLEVKVGLVSDPARRNVSCAGLSVLLELPTERDTIATAIRLIAGAMQDIHPIKIFVKTLTSRQTAFKLGEPYSEFGYDISALAQVTVNGDHRSATVANGIITLLGEPPNIGDVVKIAFNFDPGVVVKRHDKGPTPQKTPQWILSNLVTAGGLNGKVPTRTVGPYRVQGRRVDMQITVRGLDSLQDGALAMREALQSALADSIEVCLPSGRTAYATADGTVELLPSGGDSLPQAVGVIRLPLIEWTSFKKLRDTRSGSPGAYTPIFNTFNIAGSVTETVDSTSPAPAA
jgi:hypothetical protein